MKTKTKGIISAGDTRRSLYFEGYIFESGREFNPAKKGFIIDDILLGDMIAMEGYEFYE